MRFEGFDRLAAFTEGRRDAFCSAVADAMESNGYDLDEATVCIKKNPRETDYGIVVFMRVKGTDDCYSAQLVDSSWSIAPLLETVEGVNEDVDRSTIAERAASDGTAVDSGRVPLSDTAGVSSLVGADVASRMVDAWNSFSSEKGIAAGPDAVELDPVSINRNDDGSRSFGVRVGDTDEIYKGTIAADGNVTFEE